SQGFAPVIIATKSYKIKRSQLQKQFKLLKDTLKVIEGVAIVAVSAVTKAGRDEIWELIEEYALT
ncbi:YihA family ribosome biogenesis GTP-binding protein, partial [Anaerobutyricum soehngenii]|nr:YihA family ribosome biogenesis GTP-binding protein [Anaerobutyricum soehngenii]